MLISIGFILILVCAVSLSSYTNAGILSTNSSTLTSNPQNDIDLHSKLAETLKNINLSLDAWTSKHEALQRLQTDQQKKLTSLEFTLNHVLSKVTLLSDSVISNCQNTDIVEIKDKHEKGHKNNGKNTVTLASLGQAQAEMSSRLSNILRQMQGIQRQQKECHQQDQKKRKVQIKAKASKAKDDDRQHSVIANNDDDENDEQHNDDDDDTDDRCSSLSLTLQLLERRFDNLETIGLRTPSTKEIKQLQSLAKKNGKMLEHILSALLDADKRVDDQKDDLQSRIESVAGEIATFMGSAGLLLKRIERLMLDVSGKVVKLSCDERDNEIIDSTVPYNGDLTITSMTLKTVEEEEEESTDVFESSGENEVIDRPIETDEFRRETIELQVPEIPIDDEKMKFVRPLLRGCHELPANAIPGIYKFSSPAFNTAGRDFNERLCMNNWTVVQNRGPYDIQENFNRSWSEYRDGFGNLETEFWYGNEFIHQLTSEANYELRIEVEDFEQCNIEDEGTENRKTNNTGFGWAQYGIFRLDNESSNYTMLVGDHNGTIPDGLIYHNEIDFSTYDRRNDKSIDACCPCAVSLGSGWWYDNCFEVNLNGVYRLEPYDHNYVGIIWQRWPMDDYSLRSARMMIRPIIMRTSIQDP